MTIVVISVVCVCVCVSVPLPLSPPPTFPLSLLSRALHLAAHPAPQSTISGMSHRHADSLHFTSTLI